jgi:hypothetical protein
MTVTHGTRSSYNRGCRCDACREATRLARARQRAHAVDRSASTQPDVTTPSPWVFVVALSAAGAGSLWHARNIAKAGDTSSEHAWRWAVAGLILLAIAGGVAASTVR